MKPKNVSMMIVVLFSYFTIQAQSQSTDCIKDFDFLVTKIQADYPGYKDKVTNANRSRLDALEKNIRQKIAAYPDSCGYYLNEYADFFKDHHLGVRRIWNQSSNNQPPEIMEVSSYGKNISVNIDSLQQKTIGSQGIEGVWEGFRQTFCVTKDGEKYVGTAITAQGWKAGQVMYAFRPLNDSVFEITNFSPVKDRKTDTAKSSLHLNGKILEIHDNTRFVRKSNSDILDQATLYSYEAVYPNGCNTYPVATFLSDSTFYLRIPNFYTNTANDFVARYWDEITSRPNLIIDIRNNGGGQDNYYQSLARIIYTKPYESKGAEWYATKGNIKIFEDAIKAGEIRDGEEGLKWTQDLVDAMKKNVGGFVTHPDNANDTTTVSRDTVYSIPRNVGIIINDGNASSAEQFLLAAKESDKVLLFGNCNTAGVLDYSNITPNPLPSNKYELYCPMTRSKRLPQNPIDNIGIAPNVMIPFPATEQLYDKLDSWVYFVKDYLEILNSR